MSFKADLLFLIFQGLSHELREEPELIVDDFIVEEWLGFGELNEDIINAFFINFIEGFKQQDKLLSSFLDFSVDIVFHNAQNFKNNFLFFNFLKTILDVWADESCEKSSELLNFLLVKDSQS